MTRTYHHHAQRHIKSRLELWSRRCRRASMQAPIRYWKRLTHRFERRAAKDAIRALLGIHTRECHIGHFDETRCADVVRHAGEMTSAFTAALTPPPTEEGL